MTNFFYFDQSGQKFGPVNEQQLQALAVQGAINPQTPLETDTGHRGQAGQIAGLFTMPTPISPVQPVTQPQSYASAQLVIDRPSAWYGRAVAFDIFINGQKLGKVANAQKVSVSVPVGMAKLEIKSLGLQMISPLTMNFMAGQEKKMLLHITKKSYWLGVLVPIYHFIVPPYTIEENV